MNGKFLAKKIGRTRIGRIPFKTEFRIKIAHEFERDRTYLVYPSYRRIYPYIGRFGHMAEPPDRTSPLKFRYFWSNLISGHAELGNTATAKVDRPIRYREKNMSNDVLFSPFELYRFRNEMRKNITLEKSETEFLNQKKKNYREKTRITEVKEILRTKRLVI